MKKDLLRLLAQLTDQGRIFGIYEQYNEATGHLSISSDRVYELTEEIVKLTTGKKPTKKELEAALSDIVGEKGMYDGDPEEE